MQDSETCKVEEEGPRYQLCQEELKKTLQVSGPI